jgi:hypothetical protein
VAISHGEKEEDKRVYVFPDGKGPNQLESNYLRMGGTGLSNPYTHTHTHTHVCVHTHTCVCTHTHTHTHTHTPCLAIRRGEFKG